MPRFQYFKRVATFAYLHNKRRCQRQAESSIRFTVFAPSNARVSVKLSPLATIKDVKRSVAKTKAAKCRDALRKPAKYVVLLDGAPVHDAICLQDAGVRASTTLVLTVAAPNTSDIASTHTKALAPTSSQRASRRASTKAPSRPPTATRDAPEEENDPRLRPTWNRDLLPAIASFGPSRPDEEDLWSRPTTATGTDHSDSRAPSRAHSRPGTPASRGYDSRPGTPGSRFGSRPGTSGGSRPGSRPRTPLFTGYAM